MIHLTGTIVTWWGRIEGLLVYDLITLRGLPQNSAFAEKERFPVQSGNIIDQWAKLQRRFAADDPARLEKVNRWVDDLRDLSGDRNILVHYFWPYGSSGQDKLTLQTIKPRKGDNDTLEFLKVEITVDELNATNERLVSLYHRLMVQTMNLILASNRIRGAPVASTTDKADE